VAATPYVAGVGSDVDRRQAAPLDVLTRLARGIDHPKIAAELGVTVRDSRLLLRQAMEELGARNPVHALGLAIATNLLPHDIATPAGDSHVP
jgi:DNA-binding NarL/FixJ family response regulator